MCVGRTELMRNGSVPHNGQISCLALVLAQSMDLYVRGFPKAKKTLVLVFALVIVFFLFFLFFVFLFGFPKAKKALVLVFALVLVLALALVFIQSKTFSAAMLIAPCHRIVEALLLALAFVLAFVLALCPCPAP